MKPWTSAGWQRSACGGTQRGFEGPSSLPAPLKEFLGSSAAEGWLAKQVPAHQQVPASPYGGGHLVHYAAGGPNHVILHLLTKQRQVSALQLPNGRAGNTPSDAPVSSADTRCADHGMSDCCGDRHGQGVLCFL